MRFLFFALFFISASWALECYTGSNEDSGPYGHPSNVLPSLKKCSRGSECCVHTSTSSGEWFRCEHSCPNFKGKSQVVVEIPGGTVTYCTKAEGSCRFRHW